MLYLIVIALLSPWLAWRAAVTGRYRRDVRAKLLGDVPPLPRDGRPTAWFHGVSVGEVHLLGPIVAGFRRRHPDWRVVVSATTETGLDEARKRFGDVTVVPFPFDFSWAVDAALAAVRPAVVVLAESELWPNFLAAAARRGIPVVVANARLSPRSFARLARVRGPANRFLLGRVAAFAAQSADTAGRLRDLGVANDRITVTGSAKYDGAAGDRDGKPARRLRTLLGLAGDRPPLVWVAGSTHAPEESIVVELFARLRERFPDLCLVLVPRHPDRFSAVAAMLNDSGQAFVRRSELTAPLPGPPAVVLLDTVGELGAAWALADVGFTGGSLDGKRGGQSMIEPAGYGVPTVFGPHVWNFRDAATRLVGAGAAIRVSDAAGLEAAITDLLGDHDRRIRMGQIARQLVREQQGATDRTLDVVDAVLAAYHRTA